MKQKGFCNAQHYYASPQKTKKKNTSNSTATTMSTLREFVRLPALLFTNKISTSHHMNWPLALWIEQDRSIRM